MAMTMSSQRCRSRCLASVLLYGLILCAVQNFAGLNFVPGAARSPSKVAEKASATAMGAEKTLFEKTKNLNKELQEKNGENVRLVDTDELWAVFYTVAGVIATYGFVQFIETLRPRD
mmetsp:Transcript_96533/g.186141  ORF Transcript_96533/g.186141 Transcript_96533/m.186141 type:complete len:117 (+) Transcript_96533:79-429(+)|eukprot:CAMPEP_0172680170 /NCGR_PEP_ID=MMETSP1074-20121228/16583_1 /TAXON_ID=2916 /ORGANISM="Ceratium fusus, Strain PA161109" /LENGTH=116 /DNA_ID=CAMNT_0013498453 /DNA_START=12 /DNA_END=362 /DNA_ORIENTATION=+